jgi:chromosome segregation ATPase
MSDRPTLSVVDEDADNEASTAADAVEQRIAALESQLSEATVLETDMVHQLEEHRDRIAALAADVQHAQQEAMAARLKEAERSRQDILEEAEAFRTSAREEAEREATQITDQAFAKSRSILAAAEEEAAGILAARQSELAAVEAEAKERIDALKATEEDVLGRVEVAKRIYEELQETLQAVAQASINELSEAKTALGRLQPADRPATPRRRSDDPRLPGKEVDAEPAEELDDTSATS